MSVSSIKHTINKLHTPLDGRSSVRITVEKNSPYVRKTSEEAYLKQVMDTLPQYLEVWSAEDIRIELHPMNVFGEEHNTLQISCTVNGVPFQEAQAVIFCDNYIVTCGVAGSRGMEDTASLLEGFYALPEEQYRQAKGVVAFLLFLRQFLQP